MTDSITAPMFLRSPMFRAARAVLIRAEVALPRPAYNVLYRTAFGAYRSSLEAKYALDLRRRRRNGDWEGVRQGEAVTKALPYSLVGPSGLEATYTAVFETVQNNVPGALVECGVAQGGSSAVMALALRDSGARRKMWLLDSYEGLPDSTSDDIDPDSGATGAHVRPLPKGSCLGTYEEVQTLMHDVIGVPYEQLEMVRGWFQDTVPDTAPRIGEIAVLRLDGDWYESTRVCLEGLYPSLVQGGLLIIDDYHSCYGSKRAVHEFLAHQGHESPELSNDGSGGVLYVKP